MLRLRSLAFPVLLAGTLTTLGCSDPQGVSGGFDLSTCDLFSNKLFDGGPGRDGIPALTHPEVGPPDAEPLLEPDDRVLGVVRNGAARAYPFIVMWWHEIVNDTLGGEPVLVTYCPLTGSGLAFDPRVNGEVTEFGVSGAIFENNLMMFDRRTESLWPQLMTSARCGPLLGTELAVGPIVETTWERWQELYPQTTVVTTNTRFVNLPYGEYPYGSYDLTTNQSFLFPGSPFNITRLPKEVILGIVDGEAKVAYPFLALHDRGEVVAINDTIGGRPIVVFWHAASETAIALDRRVGGETLEFQVSGQDPTLYEDSGTGSLWNQAGTAIAGDLAGAQLAPVEGAYAVFWFAWSVFHRFHRLGVE